MFLLSHSFCGSVPARSARREQYLLYGRILFWSAISCGSELIVGVFVQQRHQTGFLRGKKLASQALGISKTCLGWPFHMHECNQMSMGHCQRALRLSDVLLLSRYDDFAIRTSRVDSTLSSILFWSAISCRSELIVGAFVQQRHQTGFSRGNKLASQALGISKTCLGWPFHMHECDQMSMGHCHGH